MLRENGVLSGVGGICTSVFAVSTVGVPRPWPRSSHGIVFLCVGVTSCCLHPRAQGYHRQGGSFRLRWVFEINCFSSVQLAPWITLGLKIFYPVVVYSCKTAMIHQKKKPHFVLTQKSCWINLIYGSDFFFLPGISVLWEQVRASFLLSMAD